MLTERNLKAEDFHFYEKKMKSKKRKRKQPPVLVLQRSIIEAAHPEQPEPPHRASSPGATLSFSASSHRSSELCREHLCFLTIYFGHLLARCVLRSQKSITEVIFLGLGMLKNFAYKSTVNGSYWGMDVGWLYLKCSANMIFKP